MPFVGVLPERRALFRPEPRSDVGVNDAAAWRLNPRHRHVYNKLDLSLRAGLTAAPCGVHPRDLGLGPEGEVFVKPILNLAGMALGARSAPIAAVPNEPGSFWCEHLAGTHTSSDGLVRDGELLWTAHTRASETKDASRPLYWDVGVDLPDIDARLGEWVGEHLAGYTGLCNLEMIGGRPIEAHLRGSNGFFDFYGTAFFGAWVALVDREPFRPPPRVPGGLVVSLFGEGELDRDRRRSIEAAGAEVQADPHSQGRIAILRIRDKAAGLELCRSLGLMG